MPIQLPPSDNLYKFIAIAGLILVIAPLISCALLINNETERFWNYAELLQAKRHLAVAEWDSAAETSGNSQLKNLARNETVERARKRLASIDESVEAKYQSAEAQRRRWQRILLVISAIGGLVMVAGFYLWYVRVQIFEDAILKEKAEKDG